MSLLYYINYLKIDKGYEFYFLTSFYYEVGPLNKYIISTVILGSELKIIFVLELANYDLN